MNEDFNEPSTQSDLISYKLIEADLAKKTRDNWSKTGLLEGFSDEYHATQMALLFENQRQFNETLSNDHAQFKRVSIPLVRRVFAPSHCLAYHLVNFNVLSSPSGKSFFQTQNGELVETVHSYTRVFSSLYEIAGTLESETQMTANLAAKLCDEINSEIITDLSNSVGIHVEFDWDKDLQKDPARLWQALQGLFHRFSAEKEPNKLVSFGNRPNWIVTDSELAEVLKKVVSFESNQIKNNVFRFRRTGVLDNCLDLVECNVGTLNPEYLNKDADILVGYKNGIYGGGYAYATYVPFAPSVNRNKILTHYCKRLCSKDFYAKLTVKNFYEKAV